jgi:type VI secretion system protein
MDLLTLTVIRYENRVPDQAVTARIGDVGGTIGRSPDNDLVLPGPDRSVSRHHANIQFRAGRFFLTDTSSTNGTYLNNAAAAVPEGQEIELQDGDELSIGAYDLRVTIMAPPPDPFAPGQPEHVPIPNHAPLEPAPDIPDMVPEEPSVLFPAQPGAPESETPPVDLPDWLRPRPPEAEPDPFARPPSPGEPHELPAEPDHTPEVY